MSNDARETHWQEHIVAWQSSGLSQKAYCDEHGLKSHQLSYWYRKQVRASAPIEGGGQTAPKFVPIAVSTPPTASLGLRLRLPNGCELLDIEAHHLGLLPSLLEVLQ